MSSHSFPKIDQKEYLKKYLSGDKTKKKKKDKKHKRSSRDTAKVKIIDDDVNDLDTGLKIDEELLLTGEDAPQIVGEYIEEVPAEQKLPKWKSIVIKDEPEDNESYPATHSEGDLWDGKAGEVRIKKEFETGEKRSNRTPDNSPHRRKDGRRKSPSNSPRRRRKSPSVPRSTKRDKSSTKNRDFHDSPDRGPKIKAEPLSPTLYENFSPENIKNRSRDFVDAPSARRRKNTDQSPPRRKKGSSRDNSPSRSGRNFEQSPPRRQRNQTPDNSPSRRRRNSSNSPPRTKRHTNRSPNNSPSHGRRNVPQLPARRRRSLSSNKSPPSRRRSVDQSPPRKYKNSGITGEFRSGAHHSKRSEHSTSKGRSSDQSPPRRKQNIDQYSQHRHRRDSDQSPPRRRKNSSDVSPQRKNKHRMKTPDNSLPRTSRKVADQSPARRRRNSDQSPPRRKRKHSSDARIKREKLTPDLSPQPAARPSRWEKLESERSQSPPPTHKPKPGKTLEGKKSGLQNAQDLQKETKERRKKEEQLFETMSSEISGRNADVQVRSTGRKGRRAREAADEDPEERRRKDQYEEKKKQQYDRWGKGLKQIEDHKNRMLQQEYESSKPLARYANDEDLERHLREQERAEDPMLEYMRQKRKEKQKESGKPEIPRYKGSYPENRFGIRPGYRWDGVDRSNGYEKKYFAVQNEKRAQQDEAYKYSVEDM